MKKGICFIAILVVGLMVAGIFSSAISASDTAFVEERASRTWIKQGMVMDDGGYSLGREYPTVLYNDGIYMMWFVARYGSMSGEIGYATSANGFDWTDHGIVVPTYGGRTYTVAPSVIFEDGTYKMWYTVHISGYTQIYYSESTDGINWHEQGIAIDNDMWYDSRYAAQPFVFRDGDIYKMYYKAYDTSSVPRFILATSQDGLVWNKTGVVKELTGTQENIECPTITINYDGTFTMWYNSRDSGTVQIYESQSQDGIIWSGDSLAIPVGDTGELDSEGTFTPNIMSDPVSGDEWLYYSGRYDSKIRLFLATASGMDAVSINNPPVADAGPDQTVSVGEEVFFDGSASYDPDSEIIFEDGFDDGTVDAWRESHWNLYGVSEVTGEQYNSPPYSWHAQSYSWENTGPWLGKFFDTAYDEIKFENKILLPAKSQSVHRFTLLRAATLSGPDTGGDTPTDYSLIVMLSDDDYSVDILERDQNGVSILAMDIYELSPYEWHDILIDIRGQDYSISIDGNLLMEGVRTMDIGLDAMFIGDTGGSSGGYADCYFDDAVISIPSEIQSYQWDFGDGSVLTSGEPYTNHTYTVPGTYTVTLTVTDNDGATGTDTCIVTVLDDTPEETPEPQTGATISIDKVKIDGLDIVETHTYNEWTLEISVWNDGGSNATDVVVHDVLPAELDLLSFTATDGALDSQQNGRGQMGSTSLTWNLDVLENGERAILTLVIGTTTNPAGKQEFTSPGTYSLNDGAWVTGTDSLTGFELSAGPTPPITVTAIEPPECGDDETEADGGDTFAPPVIVLAGGQEKYSDNSDLKTTDIKKKKGGGGYVIPFFSISMFATAAVALYLFMEDRGRGTDISADKKITELDRMLINGKISEEDYLKEMDKLGKKE